VPVVTGDQALVCPLYRFMLNTVPHSREAVPPAAVLDILFCQQAAGGLTLRPPYFLAPATVDSRGTPITPGFTFLAPILCK
jgi:hypothetical protein